MVALAEQSPPAPQKRKIGRPTGYCQEVHDAICDGIRNGLAPTRAANLCGFNASIVAEWSDRFPEFAEDVARARAEWTKTLTEKMLKCVTKWDTPDPKALELLSRSLPEFRQHQETTVTSTNLSVSVQLDQSHMAQLHSRHTQWLKAVSVQDISAPLLTDSGTVGSNTPEQA